MDQAEQLATLLRDTELRLKAFDILMGQAFLNVRVVVAEWQQLRTGLFLTLGAAVGQSLKTDPPIPWGDTREKS